VVRQTPRGVELRVGEVLGAVRVHQVGAPDAAVEQRPAGKHRGRLAVVADDERHVVLGVPGGLQHPDLQRAHGQQVAVVDRAPVEGDLLAALQPVGRAGPTGELQAPADVVVVQVRVQHQHARPTALGQHRLEPVQVALRIDDQRLAPRAALADDVAAVTQLGRLDRHDLHVLLLVPGTRRLPPPADVCTLSSDRMHGKREP